MSICLWYVICIDYIRISCCFHASYDCLYVCNGHSIELAGIGIRKHSCPTLMPYPPAVTVTWVTPKRAQDRYENLADKGLSLQLGGRETRQRLDHRRLGQAIAGWWMDGQRGGCGSPLCSLRICYLLKGRTFPKGENSRCHLWWRNHRFLWFFIDLS